MIQFCKILNDKLTKGCYDEFKSDELKNYKFKRDEPENDEFKSDEFKNYEFEMPRF